VNVIARDGTISIGDRVTFIAGMTPVTLASHAGAMLAIGEGTKLNYGSAIDAYVSIRIGRRCLLGSMVHLCDRQDNGTAPITIGDDVWLAHGVTVGPGVTIGDGSVVSAGSVVTSDVPTGSLAAGNPARSIPLSLAVPNSAHNKSLGVEAAPAI
jgi:maltose O-acetyltransferase